MIKYLDKFLDRITMYRLVMYSLLALLIVAEVLCFLKILPYSPLALFYSTSVLLLFSWLANEFSARFLNVHTNIESFYITAFILALIISPPRTESFFTYLPFLFWAAVLSMVSKYVLNIGNKHIFNPAAIAIVLTSFALGRSASWWVGTASILPFVLIMALLFLRKTRKFDAALVFICVTLLTSVALTFNNANPFITIYKVAIHTPILFFASVMLTEPLTMPPTRVKQIIYAAFVGILFAPQVHVGSLYLTPELALVIGNIFSYIVSPKGRHVLTLVNKEKAATGVVNFEFKSDKKISFRPGQYLEWTLGHKKSDLRGNRRYFTIASAPTEQNVLLGVKFYDKPSTFKKTLLAMNPGDTIVAGQLAGDFVLPKDKNKKLVFLAGGIGVTPFRSMLKNMIDRGEQRSVVTVYASKTMEEIAYYDILQEAGQRLGAETIFTLTDQAKIDPRWEGYRGYVNADLITKEIADYKERIFYISGPHTFVSSSEKLLHSLGIARRQIKTDFFPGLV